jgi:hypothetical protein
MWSPRRHLPLHLPLPVVSEAKRSEPGELVDQAATSQLRFKNSHDLGPHRQPKSEQES